LKVRISGDPVRI